MTPFATLAAVAALFDPPADVATTTLPLRNVAAAAVGEFARTRRLGLTVAADPAANAVRPTGPAAGHGRLVELLAALDRPARQAVVECLLLEGPAGFAADAGLCEPGRREWAYAPREARLLTHVARSLKAAGRADVLSRPTLTVIDSQTGFFQLGGDGHGLVLRTTPRLAPDGTVLRVEVALDGDVAQATLQVADGGGAALRLPRPAAGREVVVFATATRVAAPAR